MVDNLSNSYISYYHNFNDPLYNPAFVKAQQAWVNKKSIQQALREAKPQFT